MTHIIFVVEKPTLDNLENEKSWKDCITNLERLSRRNKDVQLLGENVLLIPLDKDLGGLSEVVPAVGDLGYKYLILNEESAWHKVANRA